MDSPGLRGDRRRDGHEVVRREPLLPSEREEEDSHHQRCLLLLPVLPLSCPPEESVDAKIRKGFPAPSKLQLRAKS